MCEYDGCRWEEVIGRELWERILRIGLRLDLNKGGLWDSRLGCINLWVSPEDHPPSWKGVPIYKGALSYPRGYLAGFYGEPKGDDEVIIHLVIAPYDRVGERFRLRAEEMSTEDELEWCLAKWKEIKEIAERELAPPPGIYCPLCDRRIRVALLNDFLQHLNQHGVEVHGIFLGEEPYIDTSIGKIDL